MKDTLERAREPNFNLKSFLQNKYIHPALKIVHEEDDDDIEMQQGNMESENVLVPAKRQSHRNTPSPSDISSASLPSPSLPNTVTESLEP